MVNQSAVGVEFDVLYNLHPGKARLKLISETAGAAQYGVRYQLGIENSKGDQQLSSPALLSEMLGKEVEGDLKNGEKLLIRIVDMNHEHLALAAIDDSRWPPDLKPGSFQDTKYWSDVPSERLPRLGL